MLSRIFQLFLFTLVSFSLSAQLCQEGEPVHDEKVGNHLYTIKFPSVSDAEINKLKNQSASCHKTLKFAKVFDAEIAPEEDGIWTTIDDGRKIWRIQLQSPGAHSLNITFGKFHLKKGAKVFLYDPAKANVIGALTSKNNNPDKILAVSPIPGDKIIIELQTNRDYNDFGELCITSLGHDFLDIFSYLQKDGQFGKSGSCNVDINCMDNPSVQLLKRAVCRIIYNNSELCTGTLVNNTTHDATPYLLTANHCLTNQNSASTAVFLFGYESPVCNGPDGNSTWSLSGSQLMATANSIDFSLVKLSKEIPQHFFPYFAGWDHSDKNISGTFTIHHPWGDVKKISFDDQALVSGRYSEGYQPDSHWRVIDWERGTTEPGSSGCPLFNNNFMIVGDLTGGDATCSNPVNDYFTKFSMSWDFFNEPNKQLKHWLDPIGTGLESVSGYLPNEAILNSCQQKTNYSADDPKTINKIDHGWGYWSGHSSKGYKSFAEKFENDTILKIPGIYLQAAKIPDNDTGSISLKIWSGDEVPGILMAKKNFSYSQLSTKNMVYLPFDTIVTVLGNFFAGYDISYQAPKDTFAVYQINSTIKSPAESFFVMDKTGWHSYNQLSKNTEFSSLAISPYTCGAVTGNKPINGQYEEPQFFPNPVYDLLIIDLKNTKTKEISVSVYDLTGRLVHKNNTIIYTRNMYVDLQKLHEGIYVCEVIVNNKKYSKKILISRN